VEATASFGFVVRLLETARRYLPMDLFWGVVRPAAIGRYESGGRDARRLMQDCNRMIDANLIAVAGVFTASVVAGDVLVQLLSGGKVHDAGWLLVCLVPLLAGHTVRRGTELMAYTLGHSARFARAAFACLLAVPLSVLLLTHTGVPHGAPIAVLITDGLFIAVAVHGLRALGDPVQFSLTRWQRLVWTTVLASAAGWTSSGGSRNMTADISQLLVKHTGARAQKAPRRGVTHRIWRRSRMLDGIDDARGHGSARRAQPLLRSPTLQVAHVPSLTFHSALLPIQRPHTSKPQGTLVATSSSNPKRTDWHTCGGTDSRHSRHSRHEPHLETLRPQARK
jgi:hypothetical protein